jgi:hypothetical protein
MDPRGGSSEFRFEKRRATAVVTMVGGEVARGSFFTAGDITRRHGGERVADLLNSENGFFPFEVEGTNEPKTVLYNRSHLISAEIFDNEAGEDPDYNIASRRPVSILLSNGRRIDAYVRVARPVGRDRLSDWTRQPEVFRYVEIGDSVLIVNAAHIVAFIEVSGP